MESSSGWLDPKQSRSGDGSGDWLDPDQPRSVYGGDGPISDAARKRKFRAGILWTISGVAMLILGPIRAYFYFINIEQTMTSSKYRFSLPLTLVFAGLITLVLGIKLTASGEALNKKHLGAAALVGIILVVGFALDVVKSMGDPRPFSPVFPVIEIAVIVPVFLAAIILTFIGAQLDE